jgi:hypothetical protein
MTTINFGDTLVCAETGRAFIAARDGITTNYARDAAGNVYSDEGVDIRQRRELLDRSRPFYCYLSGDGRTVTGWKGNVLGYVRALSVDSRHSGLARCRMTRIRVQDVHGAWWHGRGAGTGMAVTLRPMKTPRGA